MRMCIVCRTRRPQRELIRIARMPGGNLRADTGRCRAPGRGAYLCADVRCLEHALKRQSFRRALGGELATEAAEEIRALIACRCATGDAGNNAHMDIS